jgi:acyl-coenzyme A thioesterase PaaI-like protein
VRLSIYGLLAAVLVAAGCGAADQLPPVFGPTPLTETTTRVGNVIVNFRVERVEQFQAAEFRFHGSVKNLGDPLANARFEVVTRRNIPDPNGFRAEAVIAVQSYGTLLMGSEQLVGVTGVVPNVENVTVTGRFAHD